VYFEADFRAPWGMAMPAGSVAAFHIVAQGECWSRMPNADDLEMTAGDMVLFPHGAAHELTSAREAVAQPAVEILRQVSEVQGGKAVGGSGAKTTLVCGHFEYDQKALHPFFDTLPERVYVRSDGARASWLATASKLAAAESASEQRGASDADPARFL